MYSNNRLLYYSLDTQKHCTSVVSMGSTAPAAGVFLPRYGGLNYARGINEVVKRKNVTLHNFVHCPCKNTEQKCFIYHQLYHGV